MVIVVHLIYVMMVVMYNVGMVYNVRMVYEVVLVVFKVVVVFGGVGGEVLAVRRRLLWRWRRRHRRRRRRRRRPTQEQRLINRDRHGFTVVGDGKMIFFPRPKTVNDEKIGRRE